MGKFPDSFGRPGGEVPVEQLGPKTPRAHMAHMMQLLPFCQLQTADLSTVLPVPELSRHPLGACLCLSHESLRYPCSGLASGVLLASEPFGGIFGVLLVGAYMLRSFEAECACHLPTDGAVRT